MLVSLQGILGLQSDRVGQERYPLRQPVQVSAPAGVSVSGQLRDVGSRGLALETKAPVPVQMPYVRCPM